MPANPEISLILPTQGVRGTLPGALRSALAQDFPGLEIIVVDDAREAPGWRERPEIGPSLADSRVRVIEFRAGRGCAAAKNAGLRAAKGRWICYLDDDNIYLPRKVTEQHALAVATGSPVVLCGFTIEVQSRRRRRQTDVGAYAGDAMLLRALPDTNILFHRREATIEWNESIGTVDDACFFHALVAHHGLSRIPNVPEPLVIYRAHAGERANRSLERFYRGQRCLLARWAPRYSPAARRVLLLRTLVSCEKYRAGGWSNVARYGAALLRAGGLGEWRLLANAVGVKLPLVRRWMVT